MADKCKELDTTLPIEELQNKVQMYKEEILAQKNSYVSALFAKV